MTYADLADALAGSHRCQICDAELTTPGFYCSMRCYCYKVLGVPPLSELGRLRESAENARESETDG